MQKKKSWISLLLVFLLLFTVPAYTTVPVEAAASTTQTAVKSKTKKLVLVTGQKAAIKSPVKMKYSTTNPKVATVSKKGVITAKAKGSATVTAKYKKVKWTYRITVQKPRLNKTSVSLKKGKTYQLKMSGTNRKISWSSSNTKIATVSSKGKVAAKRSGTTYINAKVNGVKFRCKVVVKAPQTNNVQNDVWIPRTGSKYHKYASCSNMRNPSHVTLSEAQRRGYTPCKKCY